MCKTRTESQRKLDDILERFKPIKQRRKMKLDLRILEVLFLSEITVLFLFLHNYIK